MKATAKFIRFEEERLGIREKVATRCRLNENRASKILLFLFFLLISFFLM